MLVVLIVAFEVFTVACWAWYFFMRAPYKYQSNEVPVQDSYEASQYSIQRGCGPGMKM